MDDARMIGFFGTYACYKHYLSMGGCVPTVSFVLAKQDILEPADESVITSGQIPKWAFVTPEKESKVLYDSNCRPILSTSDIRYPYIDHEIARLVGDSVTRALIVTYPNQKSNYQLLTALSAVNLPCNISLIFPKAKPFIESADRLISEYHALEPAAYLMYRWKHLTKSLNFQCLESAAVRSELAFITSNPVSLSLINSIPLVKPENVLHTIYRVLENNEVTSQSGLNWLQRGYAASYIRSMIDGFARRGLVNQTGLNISLTDHGKAILNQCRVDTTMLCRTLYSSEGNWPQQVDVIQNAVIKELTETMIAY